MVASDVLPLTTDSFDPPYKLRPNLGPKPIERLHERQQSSFGNIPFAQLGDAAEQFREPRVRVRCWCKLRGTRAWRLMSERRSSSLFCHDLLRETTRFTFEAKLRLQQGARSRNTPGIRWRYPRV